MYLILKKKPSCKQGRLGAIKTATDFNVFIHKSNYDFCALQSKMKFKHCYKKTTMNEVKVDISYVSSIAELNFNIHGKKT